MRSARRLVEKISQPYKCYIAIFSNVKRCHGFLRFCASACLGCQPLLRWRRIHSSSMSSPAPSLVPAAGEAYPAGAKIPEADINRARHHLFLCVGPDCCDPAAHAPLWDLLKSECRRLAVPVLRTKAACLRVCREGPWLVVYPEGTWYGRLTPERLHRILGEHIEGGHPIREWITTEMPGLVRS